MNSDQSESSAQGQPKQYRPLPAVPQHIPNVLNRAAPGQRNPLSSIIPYFRQSQSSSLSTQLDSNVYNINILGGTGGSGGSGHGQGGQGGLGQGPVFNNNYNMSTSELQIEAAMRILHEAAANEASHDSGESYGRPPCHPNTRKKYISHLYGWSCATEGSKPFWMSGPAGTGKSAIAQSFCKQLHGRGCLGGGFFFKRGHPSRENAHKLFPTLAYQLATICPEFRAALAPRVAKHPALVKKSLSIQLQTLILEPYRDAASNHPFVLVIDGLDECDGEALQQEIMVCVMNAHSFDLRFLVVSRPESHIHAVVPPTSVDHLIIEGSFPDIQRYLVDKFEHIRTTHEAMRKVIHPWPEYDLINTLVEKSSGHFIYPSTLIRFIGDRDWNPLDRLDIVMGVGEPDTDSNSPFAALDQLYIQILRAVPSQSLLRRILGIASAKKEMWSLDSFSVNDIAQILQIKPTNIHLTLRKMRSVISLPETDSIQKLFSWHHASFPDFLNNPERAGEFYFNDIARSSLAVDVIKAFCDSPRSAPPRPHITQEVPPLLVIGITEENLYLRNLELTFITTTNLSADMAKSLDCINLEFIFTCGGGDITSHRVQTRDVLKGWLKFQDAPTKLIRQWEDIVYTVKFDLYLTKYCLTDTPHEMQLDELQYINGVSSRLLDIIQVYILFDFDASGGEYHYIRYIRWMLNISWQEMLASIATLRRYTGEDLNHDTLRLILNGVKICRIRDSHAEATLELLAKRFLLLLAECPWVSRLSEPWSYILRFCPYTENLMDALRLLVMDTNFFDDRHLIAHHHIYHTRAWLRASCSAAAIIQSLTTPFRVTAPALI
ncbi:hypothetical protein R3P38DRAFT_3547490 [Favolaschia claudopus]|uniref:Nephrocystin 3-like N-terminal domain-containing protein n=1 Tax=Favolaschia claudopus TaxID=2862362 RepID=A0AAW0E5A7_9AGAR